MNSEGVPPSELFRAPLVEAGAGTGASLTDERSTTPPPKPKPFACMGPRTMTMQDVENLPGYLSSAEVGVIEGLGIEERTIEAEDELPFPLVRRGSSDSVSSSGSSASSSSAISLDSSAGYDTDEDALVSGKRLLRLPERTHFIWPESLTNLLANLIMGRLSEDEKLALPAEVLELFCLQAMGDLQYLMELGIKIQANLDLLNLPESARKAINSKLEQTQEPYRYLKEDIDTCLKQFKQGQYKAVRRYTQALAMDKPRGKSQLVTVTTNYVDQLISAWIYVLRNQEEWRKAMPAPSEILKEAKLPDVSKNDPKKESASALAKKLLEDSEVMGLLWKDLEAKIKIPVKKTSSYRKMGLSAEMQAGSVKRLPQLIPAPYSNATHNATFTIEHYQLPVAFDLSKSVHVDNAEEFSQWILPGKKVYETREEEKFSSMEEAESALKDAEDKGRDKPELYGSKRQQGDVVETNSASVTTHPVNYFEYQPVAVNALEKLVDIGKNNTRKVNGPTMMLVGDDFKNDRFNSRQRGYWQDLRTELDDNSCKLWTLRIPSLQEAVDACCDEKRKEEIKRLRKEKKKQQRSLRGQLQLGVARVRQTIRSPRRTPSTTPWASPVPERKVFMHTQSSPDLPVVEPLPAMRTRSATSLSHSELVFRLQAEQKKQQTQEKPEVSSKTLPAIVIEADVHKTDCQSLEIKFPGLDTSALSPISSEPGSLTPEDLLTPREGSGSSLDASPTGSDEIETPMAEVKPFGQTQP